MVKRIGILGGTRFIGFHLCQAALLAGYQVHIFNRGVTRPPEPLHDVQIIRGNRKHAFDLDAFFTTDYDALIDLSGYTLAHVAPILERYRNRIGHYLFCSTIHAGRDDRYPLGTYPGNKRACEELLLAASLQYGLHVTIFRPQAVIGIHDLSIDMEIFYRLAHRIPLLCGPERISRINFLPVNDLAQLFLKAIGNPAAFCKIYETAGDDVVDFMEMVALCQAVSGITASFREVESTVIESKICGPLAVGVEWAKENLIADNGAIRHDLGFRFTTLRDALAQTWRSIGANPVLMETGLRRGEVYAIAGGEIPLAWQLVWRAEKILQVPRVKRKLGELRSLSTFSL